MMSGFYGMCILNLLGLDRVGVGAADMFRARFTTFEGTV
jgi:hypothetical protein